MSDREHDLEYIDHLRLELRRVGMLVSDADAQRVAAVIDRIEPERPAAGAQPPPKEDDHG